MTTRPTFHWWQLQSLLCYIEPLKSRLGFMVAALIALLSKHGQESRQPLLSDHFLPILTKDGKFWFINNSHFSRHIEKSASLTRSKWHVHLGMIRPSVRFLCHSWGCARVRSADFEREAWSDYLWKKMCGVVQEFPDLYCAPQPSTKIWW